MKLKKTRNLKRIERLAEEFEYTVEPSYDMVQARFIWEMGEDGHFPNAVYHDNGTYYREDFITDREKQDLEKAYHE